VLPGKRASVLRSALLAQVADQLVVIHVVVKVMVVSIEELDTEEDRNADILRSLAIDRPLDFWTFIAFNHGHVKEDRTSTIKRPNH
jgi:hypothetical protein